jgi:hypothetical protein
MTSVLAFVSTSVVFVSLQGERINKATIAAAITPINAPMHGAFAIFNVKFRNGCSQENQGLASARSIYPLK